MLKMLDEKLARALQTAGIVRRRSGSTPSAPASPPPAMRTDKANRASLVDRLPVADRMPPDAGASGWARPEYGRYLATSPSVDRKSVV